MKKNGIAAIITLVSIFSLAVSSNRSNNPGGTELRLPGTSTLASQSAQLDSIHESSALAPSTLVALMAGTGLALSRKTRRTRFA